MTDGDGALLRLRDVTVSYPGRAKGWGRPPAVKAVDGLDLDVRAGEVLGLVGESGCGKSSLAKAIVRLVKPSGGSILFDGIDIAAAGERAMRPLRRRIQMVFQDPYSSLDPRARIGSILAEPLKIHDLARGRRKERVAELLSLVGLEPGMASRFPHEFSGGQRQRVGIARALAVEPTLLICDEPISALDVSIQAQILNLLGDLRARFGLTYLFISHNLPAISLFSDRIAVMYLGQIVEISTPAKLHEGAAHPYTRALLSAVPVADPAAERRRSRILLAAGELPAPGSGGQGCRFRSRCWLHQSLGRPDICGRADPGLRQLDPGRSTRCHFPAEAASAETRPVARTA